MTESKTKHVKMKIKSSKILLIILMNILFIEKIFCFIQKDTIIAESNRYLIIHTYDWSQKTKMNRGNMMKEIQNPFIDSNNNYGLILIVDKKDKDTIHLKSGALNSIKIFEDKNIFVGISNIFFTNPYSIVVFSLNGEILFKRRISEFESKMTLGELGKFKSIYPNMYNELILKDLIYKERGFVYIVLSNINREDSLAFSFLEKSIIRNHSFPEIITGNDNVFHNFYSQRDPIVRVEFQDNRLNKLIINNFNGKIITIIIEN